MDSLWHRLGRSRSEKTAAGGRSPQLDGLRGIAILAVVLHHSGIRPDHFFDWGPFGVRLFFVLSAFLITRSLWNLGGSAMYLRELKKFHLRRFARLLPAYLAALLFGVLAGMEEVRESLLWHLGFLSNFHLAQLGWFPAATGHFWSLAVQEQFYIVWPFVLLAVPFRLFPWAAMGLVVFGYGFRVWCLETDVPEFWRWFMLPGSVDSFAMGGLLAWVQRRHGFPALHGGRTGFRIAAAGVLVLWIVNRAIRFYPVSPWVAAMPEVLEAVVAAALVLVSVVGVGGTVGWVLSLRPLRFLGGISYGVFVYHLVLFHLMEPGLAQYGITRQSHPVAVAALILGVTVPIAMLSWRFLEQPVIDAMKGNPAVSDPSRNRA